MSERKKSFMAQLNEWADAKIFPALYDAYIGQDPDLAQLAETTAKKAIRAKVLESYRNGQAAGPRKDQSAKRKTDGV